MATTDSDIIDKIGEAALIDAGFGPTAIKQWRYRGIAWCERDEIRELAKRHGVEVPTDFMRKKRAPRAAKAMKARRPAPKTKRATAA